MEVQNGVGATGTGASILSPSALGGLGSSPVLQDVLAQISSAALPASAFPQRVPDRESECPGGGQVHVRE